MCSLCAALGGSRYWTDAAGQAAFEKGGRKVSLAAERSQRVALIDAVLRPCGLTIADWGGNSYVLRNNQGQNANIYTLTGIWSEADNLADLAPDPLNPDLIAALSSLSSNKEA